jgi:hypothetical protein
MIVENSTLAPEYTSDIVVATFRHSQGAANFQKDIFDYIHLIRPHWRIPQEDIASITGQMLPEIVGHVKSANHMPTEQPILLELNRVVGEFKASLNRSTPPLEKQVIVERLVEYTLLRDHYFLSSTKARPRGTGYTTDQFASFFRDFVLGSQSTGFPELDEMYKDAKISGAVQADTSYKD